MLEVSLVTQVTDGCNIERETEILSWPTSNERHIAMYFTFVNSFFFFFCTCIGIIVIITTYHNCWILSTVNFVLHNWTSPVLHM